MCAKCNVIAMWSIKPLKSPPSVCPECNQNNPGFNGYQFIGGHIIGYGSCESCGGSYYHNWPIGHGADFSVTYSENGRRNYRPGANWIADPLIRAMKSNQQINPKVKRQIRKPVTNALLLNCMDPCYGHILWKLFNCSLYQNLPASEGLVVLIPESCAWLVPDYIAEVWLVDIQLNQINLRHDSLRTFIEDTADQYDTLKVLPLHTHLDHGKVALKQFIGEDPFRLEDFYQRSYSITFIWREDRFWLRSKVEYWLSLVSIKFSIGWIRKWLIWRQVKAMSKVAKFVKRSIDDVTIRVVGLGTSGKLPACLEDQRQSTIDSRVERHWCKLYSESQLVIGVHGSNMLIPTALAAGFIELIPQDKLPFITEDILMKHPPRFQTFLGRHLDLFSSAHAIAGHAVSMLKDFKYLYRNTMVSQ